MNFETFELGPNVGSRMPDFRLLDGERKMRSLQDVMGANGLLLGFIGDIWMPSTVRRILWLQRHARKIQMMGVNLALVVRDQPHTLYGFQISSPLPLEFTLLADPDGATHRSFSMQEYAGMLLIAPDGKLREKWLMPDERLWPRVQELVESVRMLEVTA